MPQTLVLTLIGPDRPGLVERVADAAAANGGNWTGSQMARMAGQFAGVVCLQCADEQAQALTDALNNLHEAGLTLTVSQGSVNPPQTDAVLIALQFIGLDRPGLVYEMSAALAARSVNVLDLQTEVVNAPMSGEQMFQASAQLAVPVGEDPDALCAELEAIADRLELDLSFDMPVSE